MLNRKFVKKKLESYLRKGDMKIQMKIFADNSGSL
jgi:hypothetical protein